MNEIEKIKYDQLIESVNLALKALSQLFEVHGMHGMYNLVNPDLDSLKKVFAEMKKGVDDIARDLEDLVATDRDMDAASASINIINIKQGLVFAESLLISVERLDQEKCIEAHDYIKEHDIPPTQW